MLFRDAEAIERLRTIDTLIVDKTGTLTEGKPAFAPDSFYDVLTGRIPPEKYRGKIVIIGPTAAGVGSLLVTPIATDLPGVMALAHSVSSILQENFFVAPAWGGAVR